MRDGHNMHPGHTGHTGLEPAERPRWMRRRHGRMLGWLGWLFAAALVLVLVHADRPSALDCLQAWRTRTPGIAMTICQREYRETHDPATGIRFANLLRQDGKLDEAKALASQLLETPERASAYQIAGKIASEQEQFDDAQKLLDAARTLHLAARDRSGVANDDQALARVFAARHEFSSALDRLDECLRFVSDGSDRHIEYFCRLAAAKVLSQVGDFAPAQHELDLATQLAETDRDRAWLQYMQGNLEQDHERTPQVVEHDHRAIEAFERALVLNARAQVPGLALTVELNLAYTFAEAGRFDDAERHLTLAQLLDVNREMVRQRTAVQARIAYRRGDLPLATALNDQVYPTIDDADDKVDIAVMQAHIALDTGDLARAESWARRGIKDVENIRAAEKVLELRSHVLSSRRKPYELLFVALARAGHLEEAVTILDQWQGRTLLDALAAPGPRISDGLAGAARRVQTLGTWLPVASRAPFGMPADPVRVLATLRTTDLLALVVADHQVWCVTASQGRLHITELGPLLGLKDQLDRFRGAPTEPALAGELGARILRDGTFRATAAPLHVLLDGPLAAVPVVALRQGGKPLIAARPVVRVFRLPEAPCAPAAPRTRATVIADPRSDLPEARTEAEAIAAAGLATAPAFGEAATSAALFARGSDVLHVAMHAEIDAGGGVLRLADRTVSALEISARKLGPPLVMVSACSSASADDVELAGSLATAFLAAGSAQVVATLRPVSDPGARQLTTKFYRAGGVTDPVRALARIQTELAATGDTDWPSFAVFGHDVCSH